MGVYRLTQEAEADLIRIHQWGVRQYGEVQADKYYWQFFDHFEKLAEDPLLYQEIDEVRPGYRRSVCGVDTVYYRLADQGVEIMAIIGRQDLDTWLG